MGDTGIRAQLPLLICRENDVFNQPLDGLFSYRRKMCKPFTRLKLFYLVLMVAPITLPVTVVRDVQMPVLVVISYLGFKKTSVFGLS